MRRISNVVKGLPLKFSEKMPKSLPLVIAISILTLASLEPVVAAPQLISPPTAPVSPETKLAVRQLLEADWRRGAESKSRAEQVFATAPHGNPDVLVAYALNRIQQGETDQAIEVAEEIRLRFKENFDGPMLEIWLLALTNKYDDAIVRMRSLKPAIDQSKTLSPIGKAEVYSRLGRLVGYFSGPVIERVDGQLLQAAVDKLTGGLEAELLNTFEMQRAAVVTKYEQLTIQQVGRKNREIAEVEAVNKAQQGQLEKDNSMLEQTEAQITPRLNALNDQANLQLSQLQQQISAASSSLSAANRRAYSVEQELAYLYFDLYAAEQGRLVGRLPLGFYSRISQTEYELRRLRNEALGYANQLTALNNEASAVRRSYSQQIGQLNSELKRNTGAQRRNQKKLGKIAKGAKLADGKVSAMKHRIAGLKTYDNLSVELYRQEMLDAIQ
jgi:hypothetical protein